ncbi:hypothetical protein M9Y10_012012 [Tritrichomonas musculus]|uniref:SMP-LTD domain-containing protein n=1 Tax=Tritrichomonas musculus TaxID=1915356 RepID=A0ABR2IBG7_9EUKA
MSLQFDWTALTPFLTEKIWGILESVPDSINPMLKSNVTVKSISLGDEPPHVALSRIISLHLNEQRVELVFRYNGNAEFDLGFVLNLNALGTTTSIVETSRFMGFLYTDQPLIAKCRFLASAFEVIVKVELTHGEETFIKLSEPPIVKFCLESNLSLLGPLFDGGMKKVMRLVRRQFAKFPEKITIDLPPGTKIV